MIETLTEIGYVLLALIILGAIFSEIGMATIIFGGIGYLGYLLLQWGLDRQRWFAVIVGLVVMGISGLIIYGTWAGWKSDSVHSNPMAGKRTHYDRNGKITGYSDKD